MLKCFLKFGDAVQIARFLRASYMKRACMPLLLGWLALPVFAHHSGTAFDGAQHLSIKGTIKKFLWENPHAWIILNVDDGKGSADEYHFEGMSPSILARAGWTSKTLQEGEEITVNYSPYRDDRKGGEFQSVDTPTGNLKTFAGAL